MNTHLQDLHQSYVFAYILNYQPPTSSVDNGVMTIVDNSENNITSLLSQYGFYIDNVFIAGGYGFKTLEDLQKAKDVIDDFDNFTDNLNQSLNNLSNKQTIFVFKGTENAEIGSQEVNLNILSPEYNTYNYITTYHYFKLTDESVPNSLDNKYVLSLKTQSDIRYIDNINISPNNTSGDVIEVENLTTVDALKYKIKVNIHQNISSNILQYNDDLKLYVYSKINEQYKDKNSAITLTNTPNISKDIEFNKPSSEFIDDLVVEIRKPGANDEQIVVYSYIIPNFLRWQDKFVIYPTTGTTVITQYSGYNFRDTGMNINDPDCHSVYQSLVQDVFVPNNYINVDNNNEIELNFSSNIPSYDYIIFRNQYQLEFYFNGLQSLNWVYETITIGSQQYYIWQSPQKYIGKHTWKIKIKI